LNAKPNPATNSQLTKLNQGEPLDLKQIKLIVDLMKRSDLTEFEVEEEGFKIKIKRNSAEGAAAQTTFSAHPFPPGVTVEQPRSAAPAPALLPASPASNTPAGDEVGYTYVKSPMVGTFYRSPSPDSPAFVDVNSKVDEKSVVCIIEAMKIMNEIQAEVKGTVVEVLVENGQPVEYGQRLYKVKVA
jgi:acetyl-CoA carboxylase biotin carboxyl carrier protein